MIVLTGCVPALEAHTYSHQVFDHIEFLEPITKAAELATIRDHKLGLPIIVFVDEELGLIEPKQRGSQMPNLGVEFPGADFTAVGRAMGGAGETCRNREELNGAIMAAFEPDTFTLISAVVGRNAYDGRI